MQTYMYRNCLSTTSGRLKGCRTIHLNGGSALELRRTPNPLRNVTTVACLLLKRALRVLPRQLPCKQFRVWLV